MITLKQFEKLSELVSFLDDEKNLEGGELTEQQLNVVKSNPRAALWYAQHIIKDVWPEGENAIRIDPRSSYYYALCLVRKPWQPGEFAINDSMQYRYRYSKWCKRFA